MKSVIKNSQVQQLSDYLKMQNKKVVLAGGCFDLFHIGHISLLEEAKNQGDILIVLLESDKRIQELKGSDRPLHTQKQRAHMLAALRPVDFVICLPDTMTDKEYDRIVKQIQPAIIATTEGSSGLNHMKRQAKNVGAKMHVVQPIPNLSTSRIVDIVMKEL